MGWRTKKEDGFDAVQAAGELDEILTPPAEPNTDEYIRTLELEIEGLNNLLDQKESLLLRAEKKASEGLDEIERIKKRLKLESEQKIDKGIGKVIIELLDVGDDLGRAIEAAQTMDHNPDVIDGIELVRQSFGSRLAKLGVTKMEALGHVFDPTWHGAISMVPVTDPAQDGMVLTVVQEGFIFKGKVLREARVAVGKLGK